MNKQYKQMKTHRHRQPFGGYHRDGRRGVAKHKGDEIYTDRRRVHFGWWAHNAIYRSWYHRIVHLKLVYFYEPTSLQ